MQTAAERSAVSARRLSRTYGELLRRWAGARRRTWGIQDSWTTPEVLALIAERRRTGLWEPLPAVMQEIEALDQTIRIFCRVYGPLRERRPSRYLEDWEGPELAVTEIHAEMQKTLPDVSREKLRKILVRITQRRDFRRVKRGVYARRSPYYRDWEEELAGERFEDADEMNWQARWDRYVWTCRAVFLCHYLLHRRSAYRKARDLGLADRTYFYYLAYALEELELHHHPWRVQSQVAEK